jgi:thioredoxin-related protein
MKTILSLSVFLLWIMPCFSQTEKEPTTKDGLEWYTDITKAQEVSSTTQKPIFAFFTGSDWCGWCHKLQREVFAKPEFKEWAKKNVILVELDFPRNKQLPPQIMEQNNSLQEKFQVQGFPTIWIFFLDKTTSGYNIVPFGSLGYPSGATPGKEEVKFLSNANEVMLKKPVR